MSNNEALITITDTDLAHVNGGDGNTSTSSGHEEVMRDQLGPGGVTLGGQIRDSNYGVCLANNQRQAREAYPDTRNLWDYVTGGADRNARSRAEYERRGMGNCTVALRGG